MPSNRKFGKLVPREFDMDAATASNAMRVCRLYGDREDIMSRPSWASLLALSSSTLLERPARSSSSASPRASASPYVKYPETRERLVRDHPRY